MNVNGGADSTFGVRAFTSERVERPSAVSGRSCRRARHGVDDLRGDEVHVARDSYDWQFMPIAGQTFTDSGTTAVHGAPPDVTPPVVTVDSAVPSTLGANDASTR